MMDSDDPPDPSGNATFLLDSGVERRVAREAVRASLFGRVTARPTLGRYELCRRLGSGGMGVVFLAHDPRLDRPVAIKVLRDDIGDRASRDALLTEARSIARLQHPNVVSVFDADVADEQAFIAMEHVEGESLQDWIRQPHPLRRILEVAIGAGRGLAAAHAAGLVHRDVKPGNVLVGADGRARVVDFGLARPPAAVVTDDGELLPPVDATPAPLTGTPAYMAPEQLVAGVATARSDQYAFCVLLYEVLLGHHPYRVGTLPALVKAMLSWTPRLPDHGPDLPPALRTALLRGLSRRPQDRYPDMDTLLEVLDEALAALPRDAAPVSAGSSALPSVEAYLAGLPSDLHRFADCTVPAAMVRLALSRRALQGELPEPVQEALAHPSLQGDRMATTRARLILLAVYDRHVGDPDGWRALMGGIVRSMLAGNLQAMALPGIGPAGAPAFAARIWNDWHRGTQLTVTAAGARRVGLALGWPDTLYDGLLRVELEQHVRTVLELAGARVVELEDQAVGAGRLSATLTWA